MNILLVSQYFWPESFIINDLIKVLVEKGHTATVFTGKPNYPEGEVYPGYSRDTFEFETFVQSVPVYRVPLRPRKNGNGWSLLRNYASFVINGLWYSSRVIEQGNYDVIFVFALSPITSAIPAIYLKWRLKKHLVLWIQDLWPESLSATGFIRNRFLLTLAGLLVKWIYSCADTLLVQSKAFVNPVKRYASENKIIYYPNSYLDLSYQPLAKAQIPHELLQTLENNFCVVFAGNLGKAQSVETLVKAAELLLHLSDCKIVLVGSGSMLPWIKEEKLTKNLDNLILAGRFHPTQMPHIFNRAAGLIVTLRREEIFAYTIPSKIQSYLSSSRPVIAALDGEGRRVLEESGAGLTCLAEDADGLASCIEQLYKMPLSQREQLGQSGRAHFLKHFEMRNQCDRLIQILKNRMKKDERGAI